MATLRCPKCCSEYESRFPDEHCPLCATNGVQRRERGRLESDHKSYEKAAQLLARQHYLLEPAITEIRTVGGQATIGDCEPIRLLEVNAEIPASGEAMPLGFKAMPASGIPYPSVIVSVTPEEYEKIQRGEMRLPAGWEFGESHVVPKPAECGE